MRTAVVLGLLTLSLLAGCAGDEATTPDDVVTTPGPQFEEDRGRGNITVDQVSLPTEPPAEGERTVLEAPKLRLGEWWKIRLTDHFTRSDIEVLRVVAGTEHGNYLIGFPIDAFSNDVLVMHTPGYGDILPDLSYGAHDVPFVPLRFPLVEGDTWATAWEAEGATLDMVVEEVRDDGTALVTGTPTGAGAYPTTIEYDAAIGEVRRLVMEGYAEYEVIDHGFGYEGDVRVPHAHDLVFLNGRVAGVQNVQSSPTAPDPGPPMETITVGEGYDRISFAALMYDIAALTASDGGAPTVAPAGAYSIKATAPDGTVYESTFTPADTGWLKAEFFGHEGPTGDWSLEAVAGGAGAAFIEGIGYHSIDIALPTGCVLASAAADHHGSLCDEGRTSEGLPQ